MDRKLTVGQNTVYNTIGSCFYLACQWLITVLVIRLGSVEYGGILTLAMSVTNVLFTLGTFGIRSYQVSDYEKKYTTGEYVTTRLFLCACSLIICIGYSFLFSGQTTYVAACITAYMLFRLGEALSDENQAIQQVGGRMDYVFWSFVMRGILLVGSFAATLVLTKDLLTTFAVMAAATGAVVLLYELPKSRKLDPFSWKFNLQRTWKLISENIPLMTNSFLMAFCITIPRTALDNLWGHYEMGIYGSIAAPAAIVQSAVLWLYMPSLTQFAEYYHEGQDEAFHKLNRKMILLIAGAAAVIMIGAAVLGKWGLNLLFGAEVAARSDLLIPTLGTTVLIAAEYYVSALLTVVRNLKAILISNIAAVAVTIAISDLMIRPYGAMGVNYVIYISMAVTLVIQGIALGKNFREHFGKGKKDAGV